MTSNEKIGYEFANGVACCIGKLIIIGFLIMLIIKCSGYGVDDSDVNSWNRSGLKIHTDAKTGIEYLSDGHGGFVRREYR